MVPSSAGAVVLVAFPFSDLTQTKARPAVVLASGGRGDWILCQITSNAYADARAVLLDIGSLSSGSLRTVSISFEVGILNPASFGQVVTAVVFLLQPKPTN